jgi:hypothetical protein
MITRMCVHQRTPMRTFISRSTRRGLFSQLLPDIARPPEEVQTHHTRTSIFEMSVESWQRYCTDDAPTVAGECSMAEIHYAQRLQRTGVNLSPIWSRRLDRMLVWVAGVFSTELVALCFPSFTVEDLRAIVPRAKARLGRITREQRARRLRLWLVLLATNLLGVVLACVALSIQSA